MDEATSPEKFKSIMGPVGSVVRQLRRRRLDPSRFEVGEEGGEDAYGGQEGTELVDKIEAGEVDEFAEKRRADAAHAKSEAEE